MVEPHCSNFRIITAIFCVSEFFGIFMIHPLVLFHLGCVKRIWYLSPMRAAKVEASLRIRAVLPEPPLLAHTSSESRGTFRQKTRSLVPLNGWACAVEIFHDGMLEDTNSLDGAHLRYFVCYCINKFHFRDYAYAKNLLQ